MCAASTERELVAEPREHVDDPGGNVARGDRLCQLDSRERMRLRGERHDGVAADERRRQSRDEPAQRRLVGRDQRDDTRRLRDREVEVRACHRVGAAEHLGQLVRPARVPDDACRSRPRPRSPRSTPRPDPRTALPSSRPAGTEPGRGCTRSQTPSPAARRAPPAPHHARPSARRVRRSVPPPRRCAPIRSGGSRRRRTACTSSSPAAGRSRVLLTDRAITSNLRYASSP